MNRQNVLRPMFSYSPALIIIIILLIIFVIYELYKRRERKKVEPVVIEPKRIYKPTIKKTYQSKIDELEKELNEEKITTRKAYQKLSIIIRNFVFETTQIRVQYYTLEEIKPLNMPELTKLVEEYYIPEFAKDSNTNIKNSINKTREVIEKWQ